MRLYSPAFIIISHHTHLCPVFQLAFLLHGERAVDDARRELEAVVDSLDVALRKTEKQTNRTELFNHI